MKHEVSTASQRSEIRELLSDAREVLRQESQLNSDFQQQFDEVEQQHRAHLDDLEQRAEQELTHLDTALTEKLEASRLAFESRVDQLNEARNNKSDTASRDRANEIQEAKQDGEAIQLQLKDSLEQDIDKTKVQHQKSMAKCQQWNNQLEGLIEDINDYLMRRGHVLGPIHADTTLGVEWSSTWIRRLSAAMERASGKLESMKRHPTSRYLDGPWSAVVFIAILAGLWFALNQWVGPSLIWIPTVLIATIAMTVVSRILASRLANDQARAAIPALEQDLEEAVSAFAQAKVAARNEAEAAVAELKSQCQQRVQTAKDEADRRVRRAEIGFDEFNHELESDYQQNYADLERSWERETNDIRSQYEPRIAACRQTFEDEIRQATQDHEETRARSAQDRQEAAQRLSQMWSDRLSHFHSFHEESTRAVSQHQIDWQQTDWDRREPSSQLPDVVPLGHYNLNLNSVLGEGNHLPEISDGAWQMPAVLQFPENASLLLKAQGEGRHAAIQVLQNAMLRLLLAVPPGKVRFTIFDPTGLGQNFSAFMHLADYDERLVASRIWTESSHIQQRLTDLTEHMENVIQKYLRNEFRSIQDYNTHAGEVAEPFRVLVIANFPTHFSEESTRRLISIANSGPRCGVYTLISVDQNAQMPRHVQLEDLQTHENVLVWDDDRFRWENEPLSQLPLCLDAPPDDQTMTTMIKSLGRHAEDSNRVEVPFMSVAPDEDDWWKADCAHELVVPLGRAGATQQQSLRLGRGTSQHVLISGKTGSGKSTLLHALVTNAALNYSPDQMQFYLVDFKKGVEFKPYADLELPHARVVAIESEREFGLSVLQRMDQELRHRGDLFRATGVQSLAAFREARPDHPLPRLLLIVDEFQEFFVNDDKIAHEAGLLLDRLVRQGRAFGMHLILGSQTLAGAYSLARSTIGQMAVRIALQCSATDAHLILSEDNTAARLLGRPGEAIYNDANGLFEGNHPFQVVWLSDKERSEYLEKIRSHAVGHCDQLEPAIIFEGHAAANLQDNADLRRRLELGATAESASNARAWLGAAVAIKEPTAAVFRAQSGTNLLMVGQNELLARGILLSSILGLAAARPPRVESLVRAATFFLLDGEHDNSSGSRLIDHLPDDLLIEIHASGPRHSAATIGDLVEMVRERAEAETIECEPIYLLIHDLARFRALKPSGDDFGFSSYGEEKPTNPAGQLAEILRDGPAANVHTLVWADSFNNVTRWFERAILRDFALRVLFQMSASDSSNLMDSAAASHLGQYRAFFYDDDRGESEKFRPYGPPADECIAWIGRLLATGGTATSDDDQGPTAAEPNSLV